MPANTTAVIIRDVLTKAGVDVSFMLTRRGFWVWSDAQPVDVIPDVNGYRERCVAALKDVAIWPTEPLTHFHNPSRKMCCLFPEGTVLVGEYAIPAPVPSTRAPRAPRADGAPVVTVTAKGPWEIEGANEQAIAEFMLAAQDVDSENDLIIPLELPEPTDEDMSEPAEATAHRRHHK